MSIVRCLPERDVYLARNSCALLRIPDLLRPEEWGLHLTLNGEWGLHLPFGMGNGVSTTVCEQAPCRQQKETRKELCSKRSWGQSELALARGNIGCCRVCLFVCRDCLCFIVFHIFRMAHIFYWWEMRNVQWEQSGIHQKIPESWGKAVSIYFDHHHLRLFTIYRIEDGRQ